MSDLATIHPVVVAVALTAVWALESWLPARPNRPERVRHDARNLALGVLNATLLAAVAVPLLAEVCDWSGRAGVGLIRTIALPPLAETAAALVAVDAWMYCWHRANHRIPLLWRFHRVHHTDAALDATSALRFHAGEIAISAALRVALVPLLGVTLWQLLLYDTLLLPVIFFHHGNLRLPERWDRRLRKMIVSPAMHRVHHSRVRAETDSNYSSILSVWDRLGGSYGERAPGSDVAFGLDGYDTDSWQTIRGLLCTPFRRPMAARPPVVAHSPSIGTRDGSRRRGI